jgi:hypothetical protein
MAEVKDKYQEYFKEKSKRRQCLVRTTSGKQKRINRFPAALPGRSDSTWMAQVIRKVKKESNQGEKRSLELSARKI